MMKKALRFLTFALLAALCYGFISCSVKKDSEKAETDAVETFLTEFFSFNHQQRYDIFAESVNPEGLVMPTEGVESLPEKQQQAFEEYYRPFAVMATQSCIDVMQASRLPLKYDRLAMQKGVSVQISQIHYEALDENTYTFEVSFVSDGAEEWLQSPIKGWVSVEIVNDRPFIGSISIN